MTDKEAEPDERGTPKVVRVTVEGVKSGPIRIVPGLPIVTKSGPYRIVQQAAPQPRPAVDDESPEHMAEMCRQAARTLSWVARKYSKALEHAGCRPGDLDGLIRQLEAAQADRTG